MTAVPAWGPVFFGGAAYGANSTSFVKSSGSDSVWNTKVYSTTSYTGGVSVTAQSNQYTMFGLSTNPASTSNVNNEYVNIDYGWYGTASFGGLDLYESGTFIGSYGTYTSSTVLNITYDGANVRYYKDGVLQRTVQRDNLRNTPLYFIAAFYHVSDSIAFTDVAFVSIPSVTPTPTVTPTRTVTPSVTQSHT